MNAGCGDAHLIERHIKLDSCAPWLFYAIVMRPFSWASKLLITLKPRLARAWSISKSAGRPTPRSATTTCSSAPRPSPATWISPALSE